jgi:hypothetical protein
MKQLSLVLLTLALFTGCSIQKRKYQKGFYVNWHKSSTQQEKAGLSKIKPQRQTPVENTETILKKNTPYQNDGPVLTASTAKELKPADLKRSIMPKNFDEPCDELIFKDGTEVKAKVLEITATEVKYKKCDQKDGPLYVGRKSDIFMVRYANGTKEVFSPEKEIKQNHSSNSSKGKTTPDSAILALAFGAAGILIGIGSIPAIILGNSALRKIRAEPDKYEGEELAKIGKILGIVGLVLKIFLLMIIFIIIFSAV